MSQSVDTLAIESPAIELIPRDLPRGPGRNALLSMLLSLAVICVALYESGGVDIGRVAAMVPDSPVFWIAFAAFYFATPATDWLIFRRLWRVPASGFIALARKKVYNELLLGYLGEAYFYTWARRRVRLTAAPFGAVKDVAILSAMAGNGVTLVLLAVMLPGVGLSRLGLDAQMLTVSLCVILSMSLAAMFWRRRVFSLPKAELGMILRLHLARIAATTFLNAFLWHLVLPAVPLSLWLFLATLRMLVSRLPLVPNKDLLFAGAAVIAVGPDGDIAELMALMAALIMAAHLVLGTALAARDLLMGGDRP